MTETGRDQANGVSIRICVPEGEHGFAEFRRSISVQGEILFSGNGSRILPDTASLTVFLYAANEPDRVLRAVTAKKKNQALDPHAPGLLCSPETEDPGFSALQSFGFPEAIPPRSLADNKCWFTDAPPAGRFKAVVVSATGPETGAVWDDGMNMRDESGKPLHVLPEGKYRLKVVLFDRDGGRVIAEAEKELTIGIPAAQAIFRFHPDAHREAVSAWCRENGYSFIHDPLPGYLDPYLGAWKEHMGFLTMYRANDIALFADPKTSVKMFVYRIDPSSTSYETELAYLQSVRALSDPGRFQAVCYDIGEAELVFGSQKMEGTVLPLPEDKPVRICRMDLFRNGETEKDGEFYPDGSGLEDAEAVREDAEARIPAGRRIALMGVVRPWQMDPKDFVKRDDNTYEIKNAPEWILYDVRFGDSGAEEIPSVSIRKRIGLTRMDGYSTESSVFEFYHVFRIPESWSGRSGVLTVHAEDRYGAAAPGKETVYRFSIL
ncbi:MAG: hypothetical protein ILO68_08405 [Clostridia bacterium]|nr:hypothetical protein [Clostridia bacterium]